MAVRYCTERDKHRRHPEVPGSALHLSFLNFYFISVGNAGQSFNCCWIWARRQTSQFYCRFNTASDTEGFGTRFRGTNEIYSCMLLELVQQVMIPNLSMVGNALSSSYCCHWPRAAELGLFLWQYETRDNSSFTFQIQSLPLFPPTLLYYHSNLTIMMWTCSWNA